jgi:hypothetical protein
MTFRELFAAIGDGFTAINKFFEQAWQGFLDVQIIDIVGPISVLVTIAVSFAALIYFICETVNIIRAIASVPRRIHYWFFVKRKQEARPTLGDLLDGFMDTP